MTELHTDGPHSPDYTRQVAEAMAEAVRVLNYATQSDDGLKNPADAYELLGYLAAAAASLPQLLRQTQGFLDQGVQNGTVRDDHGREPVDVVDDAGRCFDAAQTDAYELYRHCEAARQAIGNLATTRTA